MKKSEMRSMRQVVLGVAESDAHAVANQLIHRMLTELGFRVHNLGVCTPLEEFSDAAATLDAVAVVIGSVNGHAVHDLADLPALRRGGALRCPVVLGGRPSIDPARNTAALAELRTLGVDHILRTVEELPPLLDRILDAATTEPASNVAGLEASVAR
ncbi:cobalamin-dependent protein [Rhodococcoides fascians]|uniref:cobalamin-dependent protein n=1 Tax=Rhodococcoides fascians TaxID=1828 RepID=UPI0009B84136|nr:cobalamin-dependent protein [Rhodococcus fascians]